MNTHKLVFSNEYKFRIVRHGLFCICVFLCCLLRMGITNPGQLLWNLFPSIFLYAIHWTSIILFFCYVTVYFLVPRFFHLKRYAAFSLSMLTLCIFLIAINYMHDYYQLNKSFSHLSDLKNNRFLLEAGIIRFSGNPPLICILLLSLKSLKNWLLKKEETESLTLANTNAELQLLKSQIHPHFLFNTLNNIYSYSLNKKSSAADLVNKLKLTVHYMVAECNHAYVPLKNELSMISNFIDLERIRYGNRLSLQAELIDPGINYQIAPLLMLPFVENCFRHGVSQMIGQSRIQLKIYMEGDVLHFRISNSKPDQPASSPEKRTGIGLENVKKRLAILYPGKHKLEVEKTDGIYSVRMEICLTEIHENRSDIYSTREIHKN
jgi:sensor histidine kinase YesM